MFSSNQDRPLIGTSPLSPDDEFDMISKGPGLLDPANFIIDHVDFSKLESPLSLVQLSQLKSFSLVGLPPTLDSSFFWGNLVALDMSYSNLEVFELPTVTHSISSILSFVLRSLKRLILIDLQNLSIQSISRMPHLEILIIWNFQSLDKVEIYNPETSRMSKAIQSVDTQEEKSKSIIINEVSGQEIKYKYNSTYLFDNYSAHSQIVLKVKLDNKAQTQEEMKRVCELPGVESVVADTEEGVLIITGKVKLARLVQLCRK
ncbi:hypothetical protein OSB04_015461 [Centaurea solstitialis]|uniref:HMA domain-containing protein n=1 Tax=Centaurea solstitialis TaxID=347529 RepID=A0AA38TCH2_9ASTR|nr:hypothetical protein OSB04_015461 [Centaurea solstitialis]